MPSNCPLPGTYRQHIGILEGKGPGEIAGTRLWYLPGAVPAVLRLV